MWLIGCVHCGSTSVKRNGKYRLEQMFISACQKSNKTTVISLRAI